MVQLREECLVVLIGRKFYLYCMLLIALLGELEVEALCYCLVSHKFKHHFSMSIYVSLDIILLSWIWQ